MIGKLLDYRYQVIRVLATGGFGETYIAEDTKRPGNPICVVKHLKPVSSSDSKIFDTAKRLFHSEAETLEKLGNHDQIPRLLAYFVDNQEFYLVQEFIEGHTLSEELIPGETWTEGQVVQLLDEILSILEFVHQQGVIHRDIKPDNIIRRRSDHKLVLVDFGAVKQLRATTYTRTAGIQHSATVAIGTPGYMPTEQGQGKPRPNSDIYALGIIAIQALTGVAPIDLQEDPSTGELLWQSDNISPQLGVILNKMIRYHFKDRFQNATDALQALRAFVPVAPSNQEYPRSQYPIVKHSSLQSRQQTIAVAPGNRDREAFATNIKPIRKEAAGPDILQLLILALLAGGAAYVAPGFVKNVQSLTANWTKGNTLASQTCMAITNETANIRSEPSAISSETILQTVRDRTALEVTGTRTKRGWLQVRLDTGKVAWVHSDVISNNSDWANCLRDKGIATKIIDDSTAIAARLEPKPKPKNVVDWLPFPINSGENTVKNQEKNISKNKDNTSHQAPAALTSPDATTIKEQDSEVVEEAREKYESGDLQGAIDLLKSVPAGIEETGKMISQWQQDWSKAELLFKDIDEAVAKGNWDKVTSYQKNPEKLPNIQYWRDKINPLLEQAADNIAKQAENLSKQQIPNVVRPTKTERKQKPREEFSLDKLFNFGNDETKPNRKSTKSLRN
ncbi:MAG: protein kinase [Calothrix sp. C42_A2020_038]|nr:protein kinase [Calothrix sp. C42_A2020_038]